MLQKGIFMALTNTQYDEIMRSYQEKQLKRQHLIASRRAEVAERTSELSGIDREIASVSVARARELLSGNSGALRGYKEQIAALSAKKSGILRSLGYPADYFDPPYDCPDCQDTGYIGNQKCHCLKQACIDLVYRQSNLSGRLKEENFDSFSFDWYDDGITDPLLNISSLAAARNAWAACRRFTKQFDTSFENILLFGDTGVGKTFLSNCIAKELLDTGHSVIYFSAGQLFDLLAEHAFRKNGNAGPDIKNIYECDLLIIDDLGTELSNAFSASQLFTCINERILRQKSTLISSNLDLNGISSIYSERVYSRITSNYILLHLFGRDIRVQKRLAGKQ